MKKLSNGIMIDCVRKNYTFNDIINYIDYLSAVENSFIHLHLSDNENVAVECSLLGQIVQYSEKHEGYYINSGNGKRFFSFAQIRELFCYAVSKNVEFVVEIDFPAHMNGFFELAAYKFGDEFLNEIGAVIKTDDKGNVFGQIDINNEAGKKFIYSLVDEYTEQFSYIKYFHIGYDEYSLVTGQSKIEFLNEITSYIRKKCFVVRIWNDTVTVDNISYIDNKTEITYWILPVDKKYNTVYASVSDLQKHGFKVINANCHYLYFYDSHIDQIQRKADL
ncbi:MAG: family 20 glycosylhydrolase, partial [Ruminococcus sp.]|nr:family 20 glycosylhydrolase [Ruminococcus sp.]